MFNKVVAQRNMFPVSRHILDAQPQGAWLATEAFPLHTKILSEAWPHPTPPKHVTVRSVKCLVSARRMSRRPNHLFCNQIRVREVTELVPFSFRSGEDKGLLQFGAQASVHSERVKSLVVV